MTDAPLAGRLLLRLVAARADHEFVAGDLLDEYRECILPRVGERAARRWYLHQVARSVVPLVGLRMRRAQPLATFLSAQLLVAVPVILLHLLWTIVLSLVPLRADAVAPAYAAGSVAAVAMVVALGSWAMGVRFGDQAARSPIAFAGAVSIVTAVLALPEAISRFASSSLLVAAMPAAVVVGAMLGTFFPLPGRARRAS